MNAGRRLAEAVTGVFKDGVQRLRDDARQACRHRPSCRQSLVYRRKDGLAVRLFYICRLCDSQMLCHLTTAEHDAGWVAHYAYRLDQMWERHHNWLGRKSQGMQRQPSEYLRTNTYFTFQKDPVAVETRERVGLDRLMWASDYPHSDSTWPHSQKVIERDFAGVPDDDLRAILHDNAAKLYGL